MARRVTRGRRVQTSTLRHHVWDTGHREYRGTLTTLVPHWASHREVVRKFDAFFLIYRSGVHLTVMNERPPHQP